MNKNSSTIQTSEDLEKQREACIIILIYIFLLSLLILINLGSLLIIIYPLLSIIVGFYLYIRIPHFYLSFSMWIVFVGPLVKRLIDFRCGYITIGLYEFTPLMICIIPIFSLLRKLPQKIFDQDFAPFYLCVGSYSFSTLVSFINQIPLNAMANSFAAFFGPIILGLHVYHDWENYPRNKKIIQYTFLFGVLILSAYGFIQFLIFPEWDKFALIYGPYMAQGPPEAMRFRIWSTSVAHNSFGTILSVGLILLLSIKSSLIKTIANVLGYIALLLTQARSAWLVWLVGFFILISTQKARNQVGILITIISVAILASPLVYLEPFSSVILNRIETFSDISNDNSYIARQENYSGIFLKSLSFPLGRGLAASPNDELVTTETTVDSDIMALLFKLGWFSGFVYFIGIFMILINLFQDLISRKQTSDAIFFCSAFGIFSTIGLQSTLYGSNGALFWCFSALGLASIKFSKKYKF